MTLYVSRFFLSDIKRQRDSDPVQFEKAAQMEPHYLLWRYLQSPLETFREPSEMSDSGVSTQSVFSELEIEEGRGDCYLIIFIFTCFSYKCNFGMYYAYHK